MHLADAEERRRAPRDSESISGTRPTRDGTIVTIVTDTARPSLLEAGLGPSGATCNHAGCTAAGDGALRGDGSMGAACAALQGYRADRKSVV